MQAAQTVFLLEKSVGVSVCVSGIATCSLIFNRRFCMSYEPSFNELINRLSAFVQVEAIMLSGSAASGTADEHSDYDLYVYLNAPLAAGERVSALKGLFSCIEFNNTFWETEDDGVLLEGRPIDILYRETGWISQLLADKLDRHLADTGYTTCFWANILASKILFDRKGWAHELIARCSVPYPEPLRRAVIAKNHPLLKQQIPAYYHQIEKALVRHDGVCVNHRIAAFVASFADIVFAINRVPHPGEKRLVMHMERCALHPDGLGSDLDELFEAGARMEMRTLDVLDRLIDGLDEILRREDLII